MIVRIFVENVNWIFLYFMIRLNLKNFYIKWVEIIEFILKKCGLELNYIMFFY